jgi:DNA-binding MarR family transcriptional regulator
MKQETVEGVRAFNRFYTGIIGVLDRYILHSAFSLPEARVLFEIYHREGILAGEIIAVLDIDKGYLSRILDQFLRNKLIVRRRSARDGRSMPISLTVKGRNEFEALNRASDAQIKDILVALPEGDDIRLLLHMDEIKKILSKARPEGPNESKSE